MKDFKFRISEYTYYHQPHYRVTVDCVRKVEYSVPFMDSDSEDMSIHICVTTNPEIAECVVEAMTKMYS
jgi:hypothetical protein